MAAKHSMLLAGVQWAERVLSQEIGTRQPWKPAGPVQAPAECCTPMCCSHAFGMLAGRSGLLPPLSFSLVLPPLRLPSACHPPCPGAILPSPCPSLRPLCLAEPVSYDYAAEGLHCKLSPRPPPAVQPRRHLQLGEGYVVENELFYTHFEGA